MLNHILSAVLFAVIFVSVQPCIAAEPTTAPTTQAVSISTPGNASQGLRARVQVPSHIEQDMPLSVQVAIECDPSRLPPGITRLTTAVFPAYLRITLVNIATSRRIELTPEDPTSGMRFDDSGSWSISLDGQAIAPLSATLPLLGKAIAPGEYDCAVEYSSAHATFPKSGDATQPGWWTGRFTSGAARLTISPATPKTLRVQVPTLIRGTPGVGGFRFNIDNDNLETVELPVRNGHSIHVRVDSGDGIHFTGIDKSATPDSFVDNLRRNASAHTRRCTIEIYETAQPSAHLLPRGPGDEGYKILWTRTFDLQS